MSKKPTGRPSKFKPEYCDMLIEHMSEGFSFDTFAGRIKVNPDTLYEWAKEGNEEKYPFFSEAKKIATAQRNYFVEKHFINCATGKMNLDEKTGELMKYREASMIYWTKNTLGWADQPDNTSKVGQNITLNYKLED